MEEGVKPYTKRRWSSLRWSSTKVRWHLTPKNVGKAPETVKQRSLTFPCSCLGECGPAETLFRLQNRYFPSFRQSIFGTALKQRAVGTRYFPLLFSTSFITCGPLFLKHATPSPQDPSLSVLRKLFSPSFFKTNRKCVSSRNLHPNPAGRLNFSPLGTTFLQTLTSTIVSGCCR